MLIAGYYSELTLNYTGVSEIPSNATFSASVATDQFAAPLATLRSQDAQIERVSSVLTSGSWLTVFCLKFPASMSADWRGKTLFLDMARTDVSPDQFMGFTLVMKWHAPLTRPDAGGG